MSSLTKTSLSSSGWRSSGFRSRQMEKELIANKSLCSIDYSVTRDLSQSMDRDDGWENLACSVGYSTEQVLVLKDLRCKPNVSPTNTLLWELGCEGYRVSDLYDKLREIRRRRDMEILEEYVRKYKQPSLSGSGSGATPDQETKKQLQDGRASASSSHDLDSLLSQIKIPGSSDYTPSFDSEDTTGSAVNYNNYSTHRAQCRTDIKPDQKTYHDKIIPWPEQGLGGSDPSETASEFSSSKSGNSSVQQTQKQLATETEDAPSGPATQPSGFDSCSPYSKSPGAGTLQQMLFPSTLQRTGSSVGPSVSCASSSLTNPDMSPISLKPSFKYRELCEATGNFNQNNLIGEGAFGKVYRGTLRNLECAIKCLNSTDMEQGTDMKQFTSELSMLKEFIHENIVVLYGYASDGKELCLVYQHLVNGSLEDRLLLKNDTPPLKWERRLKILFGACKGLNFLHTFRDKPLIHGDIKSANILLDQNWEAKIADLGQASYATGASKDTKGYTHVSVTQTGTKMFGTKAYHAPEVQRSNHRSTKSDIYAMGVVILEVCSGQRAYDPNRPVEKFLVGFFTDLEEGEWLSFQDKHLDSVSESSFTDLLAIANDCVHETKKKRPVTRKLLEGVQSCCKQNAELSTGEPDSLHRRPSQVSIGELQRKLEQTSLSTTAAVSVNPPIPGSRIAAEQEEILRQSSIAQSPEAFRLNSGRGMIPQPSDPRIPQGYPQAYQDQRQQHLQQVSPHQFNPGSSIHGGNTQPPKFSSISSEGTHTSLEVLYGDSLAIRLQKVVDQLPIKKEQLRQEGAQDPDSLSIKLLSQEMEAIKQQWLAENADERSNQMQQQNNKPSNPPAEEDYFPRADSKKLLELYAFDRANFPASSTPEQTESGPAVLHSDPRKLAYMQQFDVESFTSGSVQSDQLDSVKTAVAPSINQSAQHPSSNFPFHPQQNLAHNPSAGNYPPMPHAVTYSVPSQNQRVDARVYSTNYEGTHQTLSHAQTNFYPTDGRSNTQNYQYPAQNVGAVPEQVTANTYSHFVDNNDEQMNEKRQKKSDFDDLFAEIMSEDSLDVDA